MCRTGAWHFHADVDIGRYRLGRRAHDKRGHGTAASGFQGAFPRLPGLADFILIGLCLRTVFLEDSKYDEDRSIGESNSTNQPFIIEVADRVRRLPPYLFAANQPLLYEKRRAGDDVIDLGMGNPSDPPQDLVDRKAGRSGPRSENHGYSQSLGHHEPAREVASKYFKQYGVRLDPESEIVVCLGSKEGFSHMCLALMGPGDTAIVPAPPFRPTLTPWRWPPQMRSLLEVTDSEIFYPISTTPASI